MSLNPLQALVERLDQMNDTLGKARFEYLNLEASRKHTEALLIKQAEGKSHAERQVNAQANKSWLDFQIKLAKVEAIYEFQKLKFEVVSKAWQSEYLRMKLDESLIRKQE